MRLVRAPTNAASVRLELRVTSRPGSLPSTSGSIRSNCGPGRRAKTGRRTWTVRVSDGYFSAASFRRVADDTTPGGFAAIANPRFTRRPDYLAGNIYLRDVPPGQYRAVFRMRAAPANRRRQSPIST